MTETENKEPEVQNTDEPALPAFVKAAPELIPLWDWWVKEGKSTLVMLLVVALCVAGFYGVRGYLRGRNAATGKPATVEITAADVHNAIQPPLEMLVENIRDAFENIPPELAEDILPQGIYLSGGGAQLEGLSDRLGEMLKLNVMVHENPQDDVALGACLAASNDRLAQKISLSGCLIEV